MRGRQGSERGRETRKTHKNIGKSNNTQKDTLIGHCAMGQEERQEGGREGSEREGDREERGNREVRGRETKKLVREGGRQGRAGK